MFEFKSSKKTRLNFVLIMFICRINRSNERVIFLCVNIYNIISNATLLPNFIDSLFIPFFGMNKKIYPKAKRNDKTKWNWAKWFESLNVTGINRVNCDYYFHHFNYNSFNLRSLFFNWMPERIFKLTYIESHGWENQTPALQAINSCK